MSELISLLKVIRLISYITLAVYPIAFYMSGDIGVMLTHHQFWVAYTYVILFYFIKLK